MSVKIICPTHGRAGMVLTHKAIEGLSLCVAESQEPLYREAYPDLELIVHPDDVVGLAPKREWIAEQFPDVFMVDDDIDKVLDLSVPPGKPSTIPPADVPALIERAADMAEEIGAYLYCFDSWCNPMTYAPQKPFSLSGFAPGHAFGLRAGHDLYWKNIMGEDWWISALNAYKHRVRFADLRYGFAQKETFTRTGGRAAERTIDRERESFEVLREHFGKAIVHKKGATQHQHQPRLSLPF